MSIHAAKGALVDAMKELTIRWDQAKSQWDDEASRRLAADTIDRLTPKVISACKGIEDLAGLISSARRECGDDEP
jgi:hypothetical protein